MDTKTNKGTEHHIDILKDMEERGYDSIIDYLLDFPLDMEPVEFLSREEIYSGKRFD